MSKTQDFLTDAHIEALLSTLRRHINGLQVQVGPWSRTAGALLELVLQEKSTRAERGPLLATPAPSSWFSREAVEHLCVSGATPSIQADALRWVRGLPVNAHYDPQGNAHWSGAAEAWFSQIQTIIQPAVSELYETYDAHGVKFVYVDWKDPTLTAELTEAGWNGEVLVTEQRMNELNQIMREWAEPKKGSRWSAVKRTTLATIGGLTAKLAMLRHPRKWGALVRAGGVKVLGFSLMQLREIRAELTRAMRPVAKVRVLRDYGVAMTKAGRYGGGTILVPIRNASTAETLGVAVEEQRDGFGVSVYSAAAVEGRTSLRVERWKIDGVTDRVAAEQLKQRIERAMVQSAGGAGGSVWPKALAAAAVVVVAVGLLSSRAPKPQGGEHVASEQAGQQSVEQANAGLAALFGAPANAMPVNGEAIPAEIMAEVLAGAGLDPAAAAELQAAGGNDPWVAQAMASAKQVAQETIFQQGAVGTPPPDPSLKQFGLGNTIAGCDPALSFKVSE